MVRTVLSCHESHDNALERQIFRNDEYGRSSVASGNSVSAGRKVSALKAEELAEQHCMLQITVYRVLEGRYATRVAGYTV